MKIRRINAGDAPGVRRRFEDTFPAGEAALVAELAHDLAQQADGCNGPLCQALYPSLDQASKDR